MMTSAAIGACVGLLVAAALGVRYLSQVQEAAAAKAPVETYTVATGPIRSELAYSGLVSSAQQATVTPPSAGMLATVDVEVGRTVRAGDRIASLASESLPLQVQQAQADLQAAEARRAQLLTGPRATDVAGARAVLAAAEARLAQLSTPSLADVAAARATLATAQASVASSELAGDNSRAQLLGAIATACATNFSFGLPCGSADVPLSLDAQAAAESFLTSRAGDARSDLGARAVAVLTANAAYRTAIGNAAAARDNVAAARAKLEALGNPSAAEVSTQRAQIATARDTLEAKLTPYTEADMQAVNATISRAQAQTAIAEANLARTIVRAPFDGMVTQRMVEPGTNVTLQTPVLMLAAKGVEVRITLRDTDAPRISAGLAAEIAISGEERPLVGRVRQIAPSGDARAHTVDVIVAVDDPTGRLRPGTLAHVRLLTVQKANAIIVPASALITEGTAARVFTMVDGTVRIRTVTTGLADHLNVEVTDGLRAGDLVIVAGQNTLHEGQAVRPAR